MSAKPVQITGQTPPQYRRFRIPSISNSWLYIPNDPKVERHYRQKLIGRFTNELAHKYTKKEWFDQWWTIYESEGGNTFRNTVKRILKHGGTEEKRKKYAEAMDKVWTWGSTQERSKNNRNTEIHRLFRCEYTVKMRDTNNRTINIRGKVKSIVNEIKEENVKDIGQKLRHDIEKANLQMKIKHYKGICRLISNGDERSVDMAVDKMLRKHACIPLPETIIYPDEMLIGSHRTLNKVKIIQIWRLAADHY
eukprot:811350_1